MNTALVNILIEVIVKYFSSVVKIYVLMHVILQLALRYHPDKNLDNPEATQKVSLLTVVNICSRFVILSKSHCYCLPVVGVNNDSALCLCCTLR